MPPAYRATLLFIQINGYRIGMRILASFFFIVLGIFAMVFGEADDSPGLQGIGLITIITVSVLVYRNLKRK